MKLRVIQTDPTADPRWDDFVKNHPRGLIYHHSLWLEALRKESGQKGISLACIDESGSYQGVMPLMYTRGLPFGLHHIGKHFTGRRLASLPRTPVAGPLSNSPGAGKLLLLEAAKKAKESPGTTLQVKTDTNCLDGVTNGMKSLWWRYAYVLDLSGTTESNIRFGNSKQHGRIFWAVKRAHRLGVRVRDAENEEELEAWYRFYLETMRRVVVLPRPYHFFQELWRTMRPLGMMKLLLAEKTGAGGSQILAGSVFLSYSSTFHYTFTGCNALAFATHANDLLQWEAIHTACREGFRYYDFGEVAEQRPGLAVFKRKWSAEPVSLYRYQYPPADSSETRSVPKHSDSGWVKGVWQRLPLGITEAVGCKVFRHL